MKKPKMIFFDFGQTIVNSISNERYNNLNAISALMEHAVENRYNRTYEDIQRMLFEVKKDLRLTTREDCIKQHIEIPQILLMRYLFESQSISFDISYDDLIDIYWNNSVTYEPTEGIMELLDYLYDGGIRTAIISNSVFSSSVVQKRINEILPGKHFEFIISSSDYIFMKPHKRLFELGLEKAKLSPDEVWHCGDDVICDIKGAANVGIHPVWYTGYYKEKDIRPDEIDLTEISAWSQLTEILNKSM